MATEPVVGLDLGLDSTDVEPQKKTVKKYAYKSALSCMRSSYNPQYDGFKPIGESSPKNSTTKTSDDRFSIDVVPPQQNSPGPKPDTEAVSDRNGCQGSQHADRVRPDDSSSLTGRGGIWRAPCGNEMTPDNRWNRRGHRSSPSSNWKSQSPQNDSGGFRGHNRSHGQTSRGHQNSFGNNSFGNHFSPYSPNNRFNPADRSRNSPRGGGRGGGRGMHHGRPAGDISQFYSPHMTRDPWTELADKFNSSDMDTKTPIHTPNVSSFLESSNASQS